MSGVELREGENDVSFRPSPYEKCARSRLRRPDVAPAEFEGQTLLLTARDRRVLWRLKGRGKREKGKEETLSFSRSPLPSSLAAKRFLFGATLVLTLILDQWSKAWVRANMRVDQSIAWWPNVFEIRYANNTGIAFGQLEGKGVLLTPVAIAIAVGAAVYVVRHPQESRWNHVAFGLLASGALGNLYDRIVAHKVTDMFFFRLINFPIFNVADSCITIATVMLMIGWWREAAVKDPKASAKELERPEPLSSLRRPTLYHAGPDGERGDRRRLRRGGVLRKGDPEGHRRRDDGRRRGCRCQGPESNGEKESPDTVGTNPKRTENSRPD